ncbi:ribonuclease III domain-containing protein [Tissierella sp. Yu-01]|uniref:Mini-ribonuclease 3 n=1 Tax=Tissierella sp. Yu-01 TaxID=3035694 RepID=UPI00240E325D|nr:ribonuclease III domain-containing protein [Tissierella sp. Yu-01]WFA07678.1 ribonuclease III domain-containing protein [Tissierella sp. Yu-01]
MEKDLIMEYKNIFRCVNKELSGEDIMMLSPLQLAYIGDSVYELLIRTYLLDKNLNVNQLHRTTIKYVKAKAQSELIHKVESLLTEEEKSYVKKGRNTKTNSSPKNADMLDYKYATGFECLFGYLYLSNQDKRLSEIFDSMMKEEI